MNGASDLSDYYLRHPEQSAAAGITVDMTDYFVRHSELRVATNLIDLSDYFLRRKGMTSVSSLGQVIVKKILKLKNFSNVFIMKLIECRLTISSIYDHHKE